MKKRLFALLLVIAVIALGVVLFLVLQQEDQTTDEPAQPEATATAEGIQHLGVEILPADSEAHTYGDFVFTDAELHDNVVFMPYGQIIPASPDFPEKTNPQPTFIVPLGTPVHSLVSGTVIDVPELYSGDYSVMVQPKGSSMIFETEHVLNPLVQVGDVVEAGQVIAEVSNHDSQYNDGYGLVEIGILLSGSPPSHVCPFAYVDESVRDELLGGLEQLMTDWETFKGDDSIYDVAAMPVIGCITLDSVEG